MKLSIIFVAIFCNYTSCSFVVESENSQKLVFIETILRRFLTHQSTISIFNVDNSLSLQKRESSVMRLVQSVAPVIVYDRLNEALVMKINDMGNEMNVPSTSKAYFILTTSHDVIKNHLELYSKINTNGKWIFLMIDVEALHVESLLITAWATHKMANILVLQSSSRSDLIVVSYNPFELKGNQYGTFWKSDVNEKTIGTVLERVGNIFRSKVRNLQNYPLKSSQFQDNSVQNQILDKEMVNVFQKVLNSKFTFIQPFHGQYHGTRLQNGSFTGKKT